MIISDDKEMAFIHIPKCAGTSVRSQLATYDSTGGGFYHTINHDVLGKIHSSHIPLRFLHEHYPVEFGKVERYRSFALVREPLERFASATFQRLKGFKRVPLAEITPALALREAEEAMTWLSGRDAFCEIGHIHFARQIDYIDLGGERVVRNLFALDDMPGFARALQEMTGIRIDPGLRQNTNFADANPMARTLKKYLKPVYSRLTSWEFRETLLLRMKQASAARDEPLYEAFRKDRNIRTFVSEYYGQDAELYRALQLAKLETTQPAPADGALQRARA